MCCVNPVRAIFVSSCIRISWHCWRLLFAVVARWLLSLETGNPYIHITVIIAIRRQNYSRSVSYRAYVYLRSKGKRKGFPYSTPSVGPGADPGVQAVSLQVTVSHPPGGKLPLLSARPAVTSPAAEHHRPLVGTKLYCLVTEAHRCKQLA